MSWSVNFLGEPAKVAAAIEKASDTMSGQSKDEYDSVKSHLIALVSANFVDDEYGTKYPGYNSVLV